MVRDVCNCYFSFWTIFCPFTALTAWKIKISIKKKHLEVSPIWTNVPKIMIICYTVSEIYGVWRMELLFFIFGYFLPFDSPNSPKKKFTTMEKTTITTTPNWRYHHFTQVYQKTWSYAILFVRYMVCDGCNCYFSFWAIFCIFTALTAKKIKILK